MESTSSSPGGCKLWLPGVILPYFTIEWYSGNQINSVRLRLVPFTRRARKGLPEFRFRQIQVSLCRPCNFPWSVPTMGVSLPWPQLPESVKWEKVLRGYPGLKFTISLEREDMWVPCASGQGVKRASNSCQSRQNCIHPKTTLATTSFYLRPFAATPVSHTQPQLPNSMIILRDFYPFPRAPKETGEHQYTQVHLSPVF